MLREEGVSFQALKTWKTSTDPDFEAKKNRVLHLYQIADGKIAPEEGDPTVVICMDEFGPRPIQRPALRAHQDPQVPDRALGFLPPPAQPLPGRRADRHRLLRLDIQDKRATASNNRGTVLCYIR